MIVEENQEKVKVPVGEQLNVREMRQTQDAKIRRMKWKRFTRTLGTSMQINIVHLSSVYGLGWFPLTYEDLDNPPDIPAFCGSTPK